MTVVRASVGVVLACVMTQAAEERQSYDVPSGDAAIALRQFADVSGREILFAAEVVRGVRTKAVRGQFTALEALRQMLAGTNLHPILDEVSGVIAIRRVPEPKRAGRSSTTPHEAPDAYSANDPPTVSVPQPADPNTAPVKSKNPLKIVAFWLMVAVGAANSAENSSPARGNGASQAERMAAPGQAGAIKGRVLNEETGQYLRSARIAVVGTGLATVAEAGGAYVLTGVPAGTVTIKVSYYGLDDVESVVTVQAGQTTTHDMTIRGRKDGHDVVRMGEFRVVSEREGNAKAIQEQKFALEIKTVIATDAFGEVSEGNVGEFLKMMPGVMIDYVAADARTMSIGGLDPKYATILVDGAPIASAASSNIANGRAFEFEQLSIASVETVELSKTPTPDVSGTALAGVVNLRSRGAFDYKSRRMSYGASGQLNSHYMTLGKRPGPNEKENRKVMGNFNFQYSDVFLDGKLGVLALLNLTKTFVDQNGTEMGYQFDSNRDNNHTEIARLINWSLVDAAKPTTRANYNVRVDYRITSNLTIWGRFDRSDYEATMFQRKVYYSPGNIINGGLPNDPVVSGVEYSMSSQTSAPNQTSSSQGLQSYLGSAFAKWGTTYMWQGGSEYRRGAFVGWLQGSASFATSNLDDVDFGFINEGNSSYVPGSYRWNRNGGSDPAIAFTQLSGPNWLDQTHYQRVSSMNIRRPDLKGKDKRYNLKGDFRQGFNDWRVPVTLRWGGNVDEKIATIRNSGTLLRLNYLGRDGLPNTGDENWQFEPLYRMRNYAGGNAVGLPVVDRFAMGREYKEHPERFTFQMTDGEMLRNRLINDNRLKEQINAYYAQAVVKLGSRLDVAPGLRFEETRAVGYGAGDIGVSAAKRILTGNPTASIPTNTVEFVRTQYGSKAVNRMDYSNTLKYLHLTYRFNEGSVLRASYNDSFSRPPLNNLSSHVTINPDATPVPTASIPNRDLKPEESRNLNLSFDRYFARGAGYLTFAAARRDISQLIRSTTLDQDAGQTTVVGDIVLEGPYRITTVDNVFKAHLTTGEVSYRQNMVFLPGMWRRLSLFANYTRLHYDNYENFRRPTSLANGGFSFDYRGFSIRWNVNYVPTYRTETHNATTGWARHAGERLHHDSTLSYRLNRYVSLYMTGRNMFNAKDTSYWQAVGSDRKDIVSRYYDYGAIWTFGVRGTF